jgi:hypothetical protein
MSLPPPTLSHEPTHPQGVELTPINWPGPGHDVHATCPYCGERNHATIPSEGTTTITHTCPVATRRGLPPAMRLTW